MHYQRLFFISIITLTSLYSITKAQKARDQIDQLMANMEANNEAMGSFTITRNGQTVYDNHIGFSHVKEQTKMSANTLMKIGSNTKTFTAVMIFQLIDEGKLSLNTPLSDFFPKVKNAEKISISDMMYHRSGIFDMIQDESFGSFRVTGLTNEQQLEKIFAYPSQFEPGTQYGYSNTNYILLTYIIEQLTGQSYSRVLKERITDKLELKNTFYAADSNIKGVANGYYYEDGWNKIESTYMGMPKGAGAIVSTGVELNKFYRALSRGELISEKAFEQMTDFKNTRGRGLDLLVLPGNAKELKAFSHGGQIDGFLAQPVYFPELDIAVTFIVNGMNCSPAKVFALFETYLKNPF